MAQTKDAVEVLMDLDTHNMNKLLIQPALQYDNPMQSMMNVYQIEENVKDKLQLTHLIQPENNLQPYTNCKTWDPNLEFNDDVRTLEVCDYEVMGEQCADEWDRGCARNLQALGNAKVDITASPELNAILQAQIQLLRQGISNDIYKVSWFADPDFGTNDYGYEIDLSGKSPKGQARLKKMMRACKGLWYDLTTLAEDGKVRYIDTNDGSVDGNAINPANVTSFFEQMLLSSDNRLRFYNRNRNQSEWPVFLVQSGIFRAYLQYLRSLGEESAHQLIIDGVRVPGVYMWDGYPVMEVPEWDMWDTEVGSMQTSGDYVNRSKYQRALFVAPKNLTIGTGLKPFQDTNSGLIVQKSNLIKDKGVIWIWMALKIGAKIAVEDLVTVGYNSSTSYVNA